MIPEFYLMLITISLIVNAILMYVSITYVAKSVSNFERSHRLHIEANIMSKRSLAMAEETHAMNRAYLQQQMDLFGPKLSNRVTTNTETK